MAADSEVLCRRRTPRVLGIPTSELIPQLNQQGLLGPGAGWASTPPAPLSRGDSGALSCLVDPACLPRPSHSMTLSTSPDPQTALVSSSVSTSLQALTIGHCAYLCPVCLCTLKTAVPEQPHNRSPWRAQCKVWEL